MDKFNVFQFFPDGKYEQVRSNVSVKEAVEAAKHYTTCVGAQVGTTVRVIITDSGDLINFEWEFGKGVTFPKL